MFHKIIIFEQKKNKNDQIKNSFILIKNNILTPIFVYSYLLKWISIKIITAKKTSRNIVLKFVHCDNALLSLTPYAD